MSGTEKSVAMAEEAQNDRYHIALFDGNNYSAWKFRMTVLLEEHDLLNCIERELADIDEIRVEPTDSADVKKQKETQTAIREKQERRCKSLLISRIHDSQLEYVQDKRSPKQVWDALKRVFERKSIASRMHIKRQMLSMRFDGQQLQEHFLRFDKLVREYRGTGADMDDLDVVCHLLLTLGPNFSTVVTALETMPEQNLTMEFVKCRLLDEEIKQKGADIELGAERNDTAAFSGTKFGSKQLKKLRCFCCKKEGHKMVDCPEKKKKKSSNQKNLNSKANVAESDGRNGVSFVGVSGDLKPQKAKWFVDSGASDHLVRDRELFIELYPLKDPIEIAVAKDGESIVAEQYGTVKVTSLVNGKSIECTVNNVLYVPQLRCNLFSVVKVEKAGMRVVFEAGKAMIYSGSELVATGVRRDKLYELDFYPLKKSETSLLSCGRIRKDYVLWHRRFGHISEKNLEALARNGSVVGLKLNTDTKQDQIVCGPCVEGKQTKKPFLSVSEKRSSRVLELIHSDVCGPITPVGLYGSKYFVTFIDDWSHFTIVYLMDSKSEVLSCFEQYEAYVTAKFERRISRLRCDNGGEYRGKRFKQFCKSKGILQEFTVPYTPEQNGVSERMNRTLVERARAMLQDSGIEKFFWEQAIQTAAFLVNRSPTNALDANKTPFEMWESRKPDVSKLRAFGCRVFVHVPKENRKKLDAKSWQGLLLGYSPNGYRVWDSRTNKIIVARDVDFDESEVQSKVLDGAKYSDGLLHVPWNVEKSNEGLESEPLEKEESLEVTNEEEASGGCVGENSAEAGMEPAVAESVRPRRDRRPPGWHKDFETEYAGFALSALDYIDNIPSTIEELKKREDWNLWKAAIEEEMDSLRHNGTWTLTPLPKGRRAITCKWVFRVKRGRCEAEDRYKARLVARGFSQKKGFDYTETYSPVAKLDTLRAVLAIANRERMHLHQMDVKTAFLNGQLNEEIYMAQPDGFEQGKGLVCRLNRSLYGLKQASRAWNERFHNFIVKLGFVRSENDQCLYLQGTGKNKIIIVLYVDDILLASSSLKALETVKRSFSGEFEMKDVGEVNQFLGLTVERDLAKKTLRIHQRGYFESLLQRFEMTESKPISTPMENRLRLPKGCEEKRTSKPYRELVGCLMYASLATRPDLSAAVNYFSQHQVCPNEDHWVHLKRILRYVKETLDVGLIFKDDDQGAMLEVYSDADWANDVIDRRSVTGCIFKVYGCTVSWITRKQKTVSLSSTEAELSALCTAACHALWMIRVLHDLGQETTKPVVIHEDNQSTIRIAEDCRDHGRLKHVDTKHHFLKDLIQQGVLELKFVRSSEQQADIMTKGLPPVSFKHLRSLIGLGQCCG